MRSSTRPAFRRARSTCSAAAGGEWSVQAGPEIIERAHRQGERGSELVAHVGEQPAAGPVELAKLRRLDALDLEPALEAQPVHLVASPAVERGERERAVERVRPPGPPPGRRDDESPATRRVSFHTPSLLLARTWNV